MLQSKLPPSAPAVDWGACESSLTCWDCDWDWRGDNSGSCILAWELPLPSTCFMPLPTCKLSDRIVCANLLLPWSSSKLYETCTVSSLSNLQITVYSTAFLAQVLTLPCSTFVSATDERKRCYQQCSEVDHAISRELPPELAHRPSPAITCLKGDRFSRTIAIPTTNSLSLIP